MAKPPLPASMPVQLAQRWLELAEQRRDNFIELYETGRWRHYYTEDEFVQRMRQAISLIEAWRRQAELETPVPDEPPPKSE